MSKVRTNHPVSEIMTADPVCVDRTAKVSDVAAIFSEHSFSHIPVVEGTKILGIISLQDLLRVSYSDAFGEDERQVLALLDSTKSIDDLMTSNPTTVAPRTTLREAASVLAKENFHSLPIVDNKSNEFVGIVTTTDIMHYLAEQ